MKVSSTQSLTWPSNLWILDRDKDSASTKGARTFEESAWLPYNRPSSIQNPLTRPGYVYKLQKIISCTILISNKSSNLQKCKTLSSLQEQSVKKNSQPFTSTPYQ